MPSQIQSLSALQDALKLSSGEPWLALLTISHASLAQTLRFASPSRVAIVSNGQTYLPSRFDVVLSSESFEQPVRAEITIEAVDGTLLAELQVLDPSPTVDIRVVTESEPDIVQVSQLGLLFSRLSVEGVQSMFFELTSESILGQTFPSRKMTRDRVPGIFTDI
jgi:hypothetical protein